MLTVTQAYRKLCKNLGVTEAELYLLFRLKRGDDRSGGNSGISAARKGFVTEANPRKLTPTGAAVADLPHYVAIAPGARTKP